MIKVRLVRGGGFKTGSATGPIGRFGRVLGELEEYFIDQLVRGDTFVFGSEIVAYEGMFETEAYVSRSNADRPENPVLHGRQVPALDLSRRRRAQAALPIPTTGRRCPTR